jgi:hypothetical protein
MNRFRRVVSTVIWSILAGVFCTGLHAATYYVSPNGADNAKGTSTSAAWKTINRVNQASLVAGDSVLLQSGATFQGSLLFGASSRGTAAKPITISSYGGGTATLAVTGEERGIIVMDSAGFRISNLRIVGNPNASGTPDGILFYTELPNNTKLPYIFITNVTVSGFRGQGINIGSWNGKTGYTDVTITNVTLESNAMGGLAIWGKDDIAQPGWAHRNVYIGYSKAFNNSGISGLSRHSGSGFVVGDTDGGMIERSVAYNNGRLNTNHSGPVGIWAYNANNFVIQYNEAYGNRTAGGADGGGFDLDGGTQNSVMQFNYSHDNDGPGFLLCEYSGARPNTGNTVRYNISQNDARRNSVGAIHLYSTVQNAIVHNNTVYLTPSSSGVPKALIVDSGTANTALRNNLLLSTMASPLIEVVKGQTNLQFQGNNYWMAGLPLRLRWSGSEYGSLATWRAATGQERLGTTETGLSVDPGLVAAGSGPVLGDASLLSTLSQYRLRRDSRVIDAGVPPVSTSTSSAVDFFGGAVPHGGQHDIGANEVIKSLNNLVVDGLMGYWKLDDGAGRTATDLSGNERGAALLTGASWSGGQFGGGISFDGVNGYASISSAMPRVESANYSISAWVRPLFTPAGTDTNSLYYGLVMKRGYHFGLVFSSTNRFGMATFLADGTNVGIETTGTHSPGRFYHVAGVVDRVNKQTRIYVDGQLAGTRYWGSGAPPMTLGSNPWTLGIGAPGASTYRYAANAIVDEVRMYNRSLSDGEVTILATGY